MNKNILFLPWSESIELFSFRDSICHTHVAAVRQKSNGLWKNNISAELFTSIEEAKSHADNYLLSKGYTLLKERYMALL